MENKLNIGSSTKIKGWYQNPEWINIDLVKPDKKPKGKYVMADALNLPFSDNTFSEIRAIHCLEHIPRKEHKKFYEEMFRVLKRGGVLWIEVPDFIKICGYLANSYITGNMEQTRIWTLSVYGKNRHKGDSHHWGFSEQLLLDDLNEYNFNVQIEKEKMISSHFLQEPIILVRAEKL